ncbi:MAG: hypothetical protein WBM86_16605 [Waterburya sp.]
MSQINSNQPHIVIEIDSKGNLTTQANNYLTAKGVCAGEIATKPFEQALAEKKLISGSDQPKRQYHSANNVISVPKQQQQHIQQ